MRGVVLGNGPSRNRYDLSGDFVLGCNIPNNHFSVDATVISDVEIVWVLKTNLTLIQVPVIISSNVFEKLKELRIVDKFSIHHVFKPKEWYNTAHYATEYLLDFGCSEVDVWGCDSIFEDNIASETDKLVPKANTDQDRFIRHWRSVWGNMSDKYGDRLSIIRPK